MGSRRLAIVAEPIVARAIASLIRWDVMPRSARAIVVIDTISVRFTDLAGGMKVRYLWHLGGISIEWTENATAYITLGSSFQSPLFGFTQKVAHNRRANIVAKSFDVRYSAREARRQP